MSFALSPGSLVAGRFRLERELGRGGMGAVWRAHDEQLGVDAAIKFVLNDSMNGVVRERFSREARAAAQLRSPHVVTILAHGESEGVPYIAMECLAGEDLSARLQRQRVLAPAVLVPIIDQVGRALTKAHGMGIVHRDLKPENIFLVPDDDRDLVKVLDFGLAKSVRGQLGAQTATGQVMGTPYYMSPEQARGSKDLDHRADLYALGVIVYECLVGQRPFDGETLAELMVKIMVEPAPVPSASAPALAVVDAWFGRAINRDPALRFQSAREMTDALAAAFGGHASRLSAPMISPDQVGPAAASSISNGSMARTNKIGAVGGAPRSLVIGGAVVACVVAAVASVLAVHAAAAPSTLAAVAPVAAVSASAPVVVAAAPTEPAPVVAPAVSASAEPVVAEPAASSASSKKKATAGVGAKPATDVPPKKHDAGF